MCLSLLHALSGRLKSVAEAKLRLDMVFLGLQHEPFWTSGWSKFKHLKNGKGARKPLGLGARC